MYSVDAYHAMQDRMTQLEDEIATRDATIAKLNDKIGRLYLLALRSHHHEDDDPYYSCPIVCDAFRDRHGNECNCGADAHNRLVAEAMR